MRQCKARAKAKFPIRLPENNKVSGSELQINKFNQWYWAFAHRSFDDDSVTLEPNDTVFPKF